MRSGGWVLGVTLLASGCKIENDFGGKEGYDLFAQAPNNQVDILFVIDDSYSMAEEQQALIDNFSKFITEITNTGTDFQIGVVTTSVKYDDPKIGELRYNEIITPSDDYIAEFARLANVGVKGEDKEKGLEAAEYALSPALLQGANAGFVRDDAHLLVTVVSDEEDCSDRGALEGLPPEDCYYEIDRLPTVESFVDNITATKTDPNLVDISAIIGFEATACENSYPGRRYMRSAGLTTGLVGDICTDDWSGVLTDLGLNAAGVLSTFELANYAKVGTIHVFLVVGDAEDESDDTEILEDPVNGWSYDTCTGAITLHGAAIPPRGSQFYAKYEVQPSPEC